MLNRVRRDEEKEKLIAGAWIGFQMGAGSDKNFGQYLESLGLKETKGVSETPEGKKMTAADAIKRAEGILAMAKKKDKA